MHSERGATLTAAINANVWEQGVSTRLVTFRDWVWQGNSLTSVFLVGLQKVDGRVCQEAVENIVAFRVESVCYQASRLQAIVTKHDDNRTVRPRFPMKRYSLSN
jgi:hypothetical protein